MTNHVHLLATPSDVASLPTTLQCADRRYVQYFNLAYGRSHAVEDQSDGDQ